jgi:UDPglucose--hexose-1-phosphate uridylyltransferase
MLAPGRARRPGAAQGTIPATTAEELDTCPFCEGREDRTPPETFALADRPRKPNTSGWRVRVVPNLYPAFERQEVVVHAPRHVRFFAELSDDGVAAVAATWQARAESGRAAGLRYLHALVNEGREAGASLPHSHSQLVYLREPPPAVTAERAHALAGLLADDGVRIAERGGVVGVAHPAGRAPYELLIAPAAPEPDAFTSRLLAPGLQLLADMVRRLTAVEGARPWNAWLHNGGGHWHLELLPRLTVFAGVELGAGIYVNTLAPEAAAETLRAAAT